MYLPIPLPIASAPSASWTHESHHPMKALLFLLLTSIAWAQPDFVPEPGTFPPSGAGHYYAGELVSIDHINRRGALRLDGDGDASRYQSAPSHFFSLLPYATVRYQGAAADLAHIPLGTHLHGTFVLPPLGDTSIPVPRKDEAKWVPPYNHVLLLEDDVSFHQRRGQSWKVSAVDQEKGTLTATLEGPALPEGLKGTKTFSIDPSTRFWKGNGFGSASDVQPGQTVQVSLAWRPEWEFGDFHAADVWLDAESLTRAAERQRQLHIRHLSHRWLPGWITHVEHLPGAKGVVTFIPFSGQDPSFYERLKAEAAKEGGISLAAAEPTLRTWRHSQDSKSGKFTGLTTIPTPPPGHSGIQVKFTVDALLDGYRPGRVGRLRLDGFPSQFLPSEERMKRLDQRRDGPPPGVGS